MHNSWVKLTHAVSKRKCKSQVNSIQKKWSIKNHYSSWFSGFRNWMGFSECPELKVQLCRRGHTYRKGRSTTSQMLSCLPTRGLSPWPWRPSCCENKCCSSVLPWEAALTHHRGSCKSHLLFAGEAQNSQNSWPFEGKKKVYSLLDVNLMIFLEGQMG